MKPSLSDLPNNVLKDTTKKQIPSNISNMITKTLPSLLAALALLAPTASAEIKVKSGETIAFMGDSITCWTPGGKIYFFEKISIS
tara:strand:- start:504 stop:758 length:255 start_codon:yes stop_codon:yes gene_type:complete